MPRPIAGWPKEPYAFAEYGDLLKAFLLQSLQKVSAFPHCFVRDVQRDFSSPDTMAREGYIHVTLMDEMVGS